MTKWMFGGVEEHDLQHIWAIGKMESDTATYNMPLYIATILPPRALFVQCRQLGVVLIVIFIKARSLTECRHRIMNAILWSALIAR